MKYFIIFIFYNFSIIIILFLNLKNTVLSEERKHLNTLACASIYVRPQMQQANYRTYVEKHAAALVCSEPLTAGEESGPVVPKFLISLHNFY